MTEDPRCPSCGEKVSATAQWCMHCSADFDEPAESPAAAGDEVTVFADRQDVDDGTFAPEDDPRDAESVTGTVETSTGTVQSDTGVVRSDTGAVQSDTGTVHSDTGTVDSSGGSTADSPDLVDSFTPDSAGPGAHPAIEPLLGFVDASEGRRQAVAIGIPLAVAALLDSLTANLTVFVLAACMLFALSLFRQADAAATLGRGATGAGLLVLAVRLYDVVRVTIGEGLVAATDLALGAAVSIAIGVALVVAGRWIDH